MHQAQAAPVPYAHSVVTPAFLQVSHAPLVPTSRTAGAETLRLIVADLAPHPPRPLPGPSGRSLVRFDRLMVLLLTLHADKATDTASDNAPPVSAAGTTACFTSSTSIADAWDAGLIAALPIHSACMRSASTTTTVNWSSMLVSMPSLLASHWCLSQASYPNFASAAAIIA